MKMSSIRMVLVILNLVSLIPACLAEDWGTLQPLMVIPEESVLQETFSWFPSFVVLCFPLSQVKPDFGNVSGETPLFDGFRPCLSLWLPSSQETFCMVSVLRAN